MSSYLRYVDTIVPVTNRPAANSVSTTKRKQPFTENKMSIP